MNFKKYIRDIPDFPKEGIIFKDISPLLQNPEAFQAAIAKMVAHYKHMEFDYIAAIEARGFLVGTPMSMAMDKGFIPIRKPGKLPSEIVSISYELEYGTNTIEMHKDALNPGDKVLLVDDLLATGGTVEAAAKLIEELKAEVVSIAFLLELEFLNGKDKLNEYDVFSLLKE